METHDLLSLIKAMGITPKSKIFCTDRWHGSLPPVQWVEVEYDFGRVWIGLYEYGTFRPDLVFSCVYPAPIDSDTTEDVAHVFAKISDFNSYQDMVNKYKLLEPQLAEKFFKKVFSG
jgi:hypothetical protein